uniref:Glucose-methanol-choline oxidoreductase N-terminal domain-containing protein n=1 Tax=Glossina brevipalpis TaxID=37001 RepID=A0A1A9WC53_9MUSC
MKGIESFLQHTSRMIGKNFCYSLMLIAWFSSVCSPNMNNILKDISELGIANIIQQTFQPRIPKNNEIFDFIVVGSGAAGSVVANRLSENPKWRIALLEAGGMENINHLIPTLAAYMSTTSSNWNYGSVPQKRACFGMNNNICLQPKGKVLGGTSSINFMIYNRGNRRDYDRWSAAGNRGWSYNEVLPYFLKSERANLDGLEYTSYHNRNGSLNVEYPRYRTQLVDAFIRGSEQAGHPRTDYNGESQRGVSYVQATTNSGRRHSAYRAFIEPIIQRRSNLQIFIFSRVTKILIEPISKIAYGVEFVYNNRSYTIKARKEVVVSAGAFNSPQLLMLSGVGPRDNLSKLGIPIIKESPVGVRMYEHASHFGPTFLTNTTGQSLFTSNVRPRDVLRFFAGGPDTVLSSLTGVEALAFLNVPLSTLPNDWPDVELIFASGSLASDEGTALKIGANFKDKIYNQLYRDIERKRQDHFTILVMPFHPKSIGRIWLRSKDPLQWPVIDPNYFAEKEDVDFMLQGIKAAIAIAQTPAMQKIGTRILPVPVPGCESFNFASDDYWRCSIRTMTYTLHHQVATCRMGPSTDPTAVVSPELSVHGIQKLRVIDTSIIPFPPTAHTNAPAFMIGEKGADLIRRTWKIAK